MRIVLAASSLSASEGSSSDGSWRGVSVSSSSVLRQRAGRGDAITDVLFGALAGRSTQQVARRCRGGRSLIVCRNRSCGGGGLGTCAGVPRPAVCSDRRANLHLSSRQVEASKAPSSLARRPESRERGRAPWICTRTVRARRALRVKVPPAAGRSGVVHRTSSSECVAAAPATFVTRKLVTWTGLCGSINRSQCNATRRPDDTY